MYDPSLAYHIKELLRNDISQEIADAHVLMIMQSDKLDPPHATLNRLAISIHETHHYRHINLYLMICEKFKMPKPEMNNLFATDMEE